jgi:predicted membrane-bound spermidine synthase
VQLPRMSLLIVAIALACAGLGAWLGNTIADDTGSIVAVALICGVLGSFAPGTIRWASAEVRKHDRRPR